MRYRFFILFLAAGFADVQTRCCSADPSDSLARGQRQLFFDDLGIERRDNLKRVVHQPTKHPQNPVLRREHPWEGFRIQVYGTMIYDPHAQLFKSWYMNIPKTAAEKITVDGEGRPGHATLLCYATSKDGIQWDKPVLNIVDFEGSTENNMISRDMYNPEGFSVLYEPQDPDPSRRYKAFYWDHGYGPTIKFEGQEIYGSGPKDGMYVAFSPDGIHWTPYEGNPVMKLDSDTGQVVLFDDQLGKYVAFGRFGAGGRKVARSESDDFIHWSTSQLVLEPDERDGEKTQFYGITVNYYGGMYIGVLWMFWIDEGRVGTIDFQLCHSRDGKTWVRDSDRTVFLPTGPPVSWDASDMRGASRSVILDDRILFYYAGSPARHGLGGEKRIGMDIGLATLRRDGWVSLDAGNREGTLITKSFVYPAGSLYLNADASRGRITATIEDARGDPIRGFEGSLPMTADSLRMKPRFDKSSDALAGRTVRLALQLKDASVYSFWVE